MFFLANFQFAILLWKKEMQDQPNQPPLFTILLLILTALRHFLLSFSLSCFVRSDWRKVIVGQKLFSFSKNGFYPKSRLERIIFGGGDEKGICNLEICSQWYLGWEHIPWDCLLSLEPGFANVTQTKFQQRQRQSFSLKSGFANMM